MDILSGIGFDWQVALVNFLNFLLIFWVLKKFVFPIISEIISKRKDIIEKSLNDAKEINLKLESVNKESEEIIKTAKKNAEKNIKDSLILAKEKSDKILEESKIKAKKIVDGEKKRGLKEKEKIIKSADTEIAKLAILSAKKILDEN